MINYSVLDCSCHGALRTGIKRQQTINLRVQERGINIHEFWLPRVVLYGVETFSR
jgi:hypothetical protein